MADISILFGLLAMLGWGVSDFLCKRAVDRTGAYTAAVYVYSVGAVLSVLLFFLFPRYSPITSFLAVLFVIEAILTSVGYVAMYQGMAAAQLSLVGPLVASYPWIIVLLSVVLLGEKIVPLQIAALILMIAGLIALSRQGTGGMNRRRGIVFAVIAMLIFGLSVFTYGYLVKVTSWIFALVIGRVLASFFIFSFVRARKIPLSGSWQMAPLILFASITEVGGTVAYSIGISMSLLSVISVVASLYPLVTLILARLILKEQLQKHQYLGVAGILIGLALISL